MRRNKTSCDSKNKKSFHAIAERDTKYVDEIPILLKHMKFKIRNINY